MQQIYRGVCTGSRWVRPLYCEILPALRCVLPSAVDAHRNGCSLSVSGGERWWQGWAGHLEAALRAVGACLAACLYQVLLWRSHWVGADAIDFVAQGTTSVRSYSPATLE